MIIQKALALGAGVLVSLGLAACNDSPETAGEEPVDAFFETPKKTVPRAHRNQMRNEPTEFLRRRANDPSHWQVWSPQVFADAETEQRLVFAVVGSGRHPETIRFLDKLRDSPALIDKLHENYLCSLVDLEVNPELGPMLSILASEIRRSIAFPCMIWLSHEGNPVAWLPLTPNDIEDFAEVFGNSHAMVSRIWRESPGYVVRNSRRDNESRQAKTLPRLPGESAAGAPPSAAEDPATEDPATEDPATEDLPEPVEIAKLEEVFPGAVRKLTSMYDPASGMIDGSGGLVPSGLLNLSVLVAAAPGTSERLGERARELLDGTCEVLLRGAIRDPLDGGFFSARRSSGWDLPVFIKTLDTQAPVALAYGRAAAVYGSARYLEAARGILTYAEQALGEGGEGLGLYEVVPSRTLQPRVFLWSQERLRELLTAAEFKVATAAFQTSGIGNIPPESDPQRDFFRKNSLGLKRTPAELATELGITEEETRETLDAACRRLMAQRKELLTRVEGVFREGTRVTESNARVAGSLAAFSGFSGDSESLEQARKILGFLKTRHYSEDGGLLRIAATGDYRQVRARGADYAALLNALFAVYRLDLDPAHLVWARALADELLQAHQVRPGRIMEVRDSEQVGLLEVYNNSMLFGDSTWGAVYGPLVRLHQLTGSEAYHETADALRDLLILSLTSSGGPREMIHTDFLSNAMIPLADTIVYLSGDPDSPEFSALHKILLNPAYHAVTVLYLGNPLPSGIVAPVEPSPTPSARVFAGKAGLGEAESSADLERLLREALAGG